MGLVTVFWPLMATGAGEFVLQAEGEVKFVVDCKVNPTALVDHFKTIPPGEVPEGVMVTCAGEESRFVGSVPASHSCQLSTPSPSVSAPSVAGLMGRLNCWSQA